MNANLKKWIAYTFHEGMKIKVHDVNIKKDSMIRRRYESIVGEVGVVKVVNPTRGNIIVYFKSTDERLMIKIGEDKIEIIGE